jgi:hypothetical protein
MDLPEVLSQHIQESLALISRKGRHCQDWLLQSWPHRARDHRFGLRLRRPAQDHLRLQHHQEVRPHRRRLRPLRRPQRRHGPLRPRHLRRRARPARVQHPGRRPPARLRRRTPRPQPDLRPCACRASGQGEHHLWRGVRRRRRPEHDLRREGVCDAVRFGGHHCRLGGCHSVFQGRRQGPGQEHAYEWSDRPGR